MGNEVKEVRVKDLYVQCMFPMRPDAIAASDCCQAMADTAVERRDGMQSWRCQEHRGLIKHDLSGPVHETVLTTADVPDEVVVSWPD